jgi:hypothetical protein
MSGLYGFFLRQTRNADEELANIRQLYYSMSNDQRKKFKQDIHALVEASRPFECTEMTVEVKYQASAHDHEGNRITAKANRSPREILKAIDEWDQADEKIPSII